LGIRDQQYESQYIFDRNYNAKTFEEFVKVQVRAGRPLLINPAFWDGLGIEASEHDT